MVSEFVPIIRCDFTHGKPMTPTCKRSADLLWRSALKHASDLSRQHTPALGTRSLGVLHVASALELGLKRFVTFDVRQRQLALATGLKVVTPAK